jgi:CBS domain-containing protein
MPDNTDFSARGCSHSDAAHRIMTYDYDRSVLAIVAGTIGKLRGRNENVGKTSWQDKGVAGTQSVVERAYREVRGLFKGSRSCRNSSDEAADIALASAFDAEVNDGNLLEKRQEIFHILASDMHSLFESRLEVRHLMTRRLTTVSPDTSADDVKRLMKEKHLGHLLVCDDNGQLLGIISDRDLLRAGGGTAEGIMTRDLVTVQLDAQINPAITLLIQHRISCLPVLDGDRLCGVLTTAELLTALQGTLQMLKKVADEISPSE